MTRTCTCCVAGTSRLQKQLAHTLSATCWMLTYFGLVQLFVHLWESTLCYYMAANCEKQQGCRLCVCVWYSTSCRSHHSKHCCQHFERIHRILLSSAGTRVGEGGMCQRQYCECPNFPTFSRVQVHMTCNDGLSF